MLSKLLRIALIIATLLAALPAGAQGVDRSPIWASVKVRGCSSGYLKHASTTCVTAIPAADLAAGAAVANIGYTPANKAGDTFSGNVTISKTSPSFTLKKGASGELNRFSGATGALNRWTVDYGNQTAESGSNVGSDLDFGRWDDSGAFLSYALRLWRSTGNISINTGSYLNYGFVTVGSAGYGFFDNNGTLQIKHSGGAWANLPAGPATSSDVQAGTNATKFVTASALSGSATPQTLVDGATISWDVSLGYNANVTLGGNRTMAAPTNVITGLTYTVHVCQPSSGGPWTMTWNAAFSWGVAGTPTLTTTASKCDMAVCYAWSTSSLHCSITKGF